MTPDEAQTAGARTELIATVTALKRMVSQEPPHLRPGLECAIGLLERRLADVAAAGLDPSRPELLPELAAPEAVPVKALPPRPAPPSAPRVAARSGSRVRLPSRVSFDDEDLRCPHCAVVVLKRERINLGADRGGAPEFCPKCGERTGVEPPPLPSS